MVSKKKIALERDARNRALRTFIQGLAIDILVAASVSIHAILSTDGPIQWAIVGASLGRSVLQAAASYIMRKFVDPSNIPTPLPPDPPGEPDNDIDGP